MKILNRKSNITNEIINQLFTINIYLHAIFTSMKIRTSLTYLVGHDSVNRSSEAASKGVITKGET